MRIYLDSCCFNRPFDDLSQDRIYYEAIAILSIIRKNIKNDYIIIGSDFVLFEISMTQDKHKRENMLELYSLVDNIVEYNKDIEARAEMMRNITGMKLFDSLHISCAEYGQADVFLTTDDKLIKRRELMPFSMRIVDPVTYIMETI